MTLATLDAPTVEGAPQNLRQFPPPRRPRLKSNRQQCRGCRRAPPRERPRSWSEGKREVPRGRVHSACPSAGPGDIHSTGWAMSRIAVQRLLPLSRERKGRRTRDKGVGRDELSARQRGRRTVRPERRPKGELSHRRRDLVCCGAGRRRCRLSGRVSVGGR